MLKETKDPSPLVICFNACCFKLIQWNAAEVQSQWGRNFLPVYEISPNSTSWRVCNGNSGLESQQCCGNQIHRMTVHLCLQLNEHNASSWLADFDPQRVIYCTWNYSIKRGSTETKHKREYKPNKMYQHFTFTETFVNWKKICVHITFFYWLSTFYFI